MVTQYRRQRVPSWTELTVAFVALFGAFAFQAMGGWWIALAVLLWLVALAATAD